jgi:hypothetical protein
MVYLMAQWLKLYSTYVCNKLDRTWKEAIMAKFEVLFWQLPRGTQENYGKLQDKWHPSQDLNQAPPE